MIMNENLYKNFEKTYPACKAVLGPKAWERLIKSLGKAEISDRLPDLIQTMTDKTILPDFLPDLARLEWVMHSVKKSKTKISLPARHIEVNPTMEVLQLSWHCTETVNQEGRGHPRLPAPGEEWVLVWRDHRDDSLQVQSASEEDLLALKIVVENLPHEQITGTGEISPQRLESIFRNCLDRSLLLEPRSQIRRDISLYKDASAIPERFLTSNYFTLQWHITHACDLHCKHCYDRSKRSAVTHKQGLRILDDLKTFCRERHVKGHACFTGGNPLMHPRFMDLYRNATERGFSTSILGNPAPRTQIEDLPAVQKPAYFQVSLEGLPEHNDWIRGKGNFARVIEFLGVLRDVGISSAVMLTLTRDNMDQILPLAERLRGHTDHFTFNRLSPVGEGAKLCLPDKKAFRSFLESYVQATETNPILGIKDNLINIIYQREGKAPYGGCTGFGCGAAFSFFAVLPDGEVHACRKFPSLIGNVLNQSLGEIYDSDLAARYRRGTTACAECSLKPMCGGCLSIIDGQDLDISKDMDPHCFMDEI
jgi:selenobiotic family peptide radical SAM maturase